MLKPADLAVRPDLRIGSLNISPGRRAVEGPEGRVNLEPRVMQVFLMLVDAGGRVVTRTELFDQCWGGAMVGDDNINRAIAAIRRIPNEVAPAAFEVETIPRTGYRLVWRPDPAAQVEDVGRNSPTEAARPPHSASRRKLIVGAAAVALTGGGVTLWRSLTARLDPRFDALMDRGGDALRLDDPAAARYFQDAVALEPRDASAWGLLACALASEGSFGAPVGTGPRAQSAERAARTALSIDPEEPNALLAMTLVQADMIDWYSREDRYRGVLAIDPDNMLAMRLLGTLMHGVGRCREALAIVERATVIEPLTPDHQLRKAMRLWVLGQIAQADRVIDRAMELWPAHRMVRLARLMIYAFTGRPAAALAMVQDEEATPELLSPSAISFWRASLEAIGNPTAVNVAAARKRIVDGSKGTAAIAAAAILVLSALGELDTAFDVANGFLLGRGQVIVRTRAETKEPAVNGPGWRNTYGLFTPPTKAMRLDPRFGPLADGLGLSEYWRRRGIGPDKFLFTA